MKRIAFTICYNALHHLKHNDFAERMCSMFDEWVIVEGAAKNTGSTSWCNPHPGDDNSTDGTIEYLMQLQAGHRNVHVAIGGGKWLSKDHMCNRALAMIKHFCPEQCILWQVDADEQWTPEALQKNETALLNSGRTAGAIQWHQFVSHDLISIGDWGSGFNNRVWILRPSQLFKSHEPPILTGQTAIAELPEKCNHFSYYFERDVYFKSMYYKGYADVYNNWIQLQLKREKLKFPLHVSFLFGNGNWIGKSNSKIILFQQPQTNENENQLEVPHQKN